MHTDPEIGLTDSEVDAHSSAGHRRALRKLNLPPATNFVVKGKDSKLRPWSESAKLESLSGSGAGFLISEECLVGRLVSLILPMPKHLRRYDADKRLYRVWGLVQYCYKAADDSAAGFHAGVAFIGKDAPESYVKDPMHSYRVCGVDRNGLWKIEELENPFKQRSSVRYRNSLEVSIYQLDENQRSIAGEQTVTENISESGALVFSDLRLSVGDSVKFQSNSPAFSSICIVRHRRIGLDDRMRLHLEFVDNSFPVAEIEAPIEEAGEH